MITQGKVWNYFLYAIGEIFLVVIGILIAVQIDDWNQEQKNRALGQEYRNRLLNDLTADLKAIDVRMRFFDIVYQYGKYALDEMEKENTDDLDKQWEFVYAAFQSSQLWPFKTSTTTYNELQSTGLLQYIGNDSLLNRMSNYYIDSPEQLSQLVGGVVAYRDFIRGVVPIAIQEFIWEECFEVGTFEIQQFKPCKPPESFNADLTKVYLFIKNNPDFKRLLTRRLSTIAVRDEVYSTTYDYAESLAESLKK